MLHGLFSSCGAQGLLPSCTAWLLIVGASLVAEHGLWGARPSGVVVCGPSSYDSQALEHRLDSCGTGTSLFWSMCIFLGQESSSWLLHTDPLPLSHQGSPIFLLIICPLVQEVSQTRTWRSGGRIRLRSPPDPLTLFGLYVYARPSWRGSAVFTVLGVPYPAWAPLPRGPPWLPRP